MTRTFGRIRLAVVPLLGAAALVAPAAPAPAAPSAAAPSDLYVTSKSTCRAGGTGSQESPLCTISAAAAVAQPGQTVWIAAGNYPEKVRLTRSGTEAAPIVFRAVNEYGRTVRVGNFNSLNWTGPALDVDGVHDVRVEGLTLHGGPSSSFAELARVRGSQRVTFDGLAGSSGTRPVVRVAAGSADVTVSRGWFAGAGGAGVVVEPGVSGTVVTASTFRSSHLLVTDAPGTTVTGNTVVTDCTAGVRVTGASPGTAVANNLIRTGAGPVPDPQPCADPAAATAISVSADSVPQSTAHHNLIDPAGGGPLYSWAGTDHTDLAAFRATTGQGADDLAAPAQLQAQQGTERGWFPLASTSPAVDSADPTATGATATDLLLNAHADAPTAPNTGGAFRDRGAVELQGKLTVTGGKVQPVGGVNPFDVTTSLAVTSDWPTDGPVGTIVRRWSGEAFYRAVPGGRAEHRARRAGPVCAEQFASTDGFRLIPEIIFTPPPECAVVGARYTAVSPVRVLDTRAAVGVGTTVPLAANTELVLPMQTVDGVPAADVSAVVLNLTVTQPTASGFIRIWPDGRTMPDVSNVNYVAGETVPNLVTVPMSNGNLRIRNTGSGTVHVVADLQGFYAAAGSGFKAVTPLRVLDSRGSTPLASNSYRVLDLTGRVPSGTTAVALNVTVTRPTASGVLKVYPYGAMSLPTASNLNFVAGQTIPNMVLVPVVNGRAVIYNASSGSTHVVVDLLGRFGADATDVLVPLDPRRVLDTRPVDPIGPTLRAGFRSAYIGFSQPEITAVVANVTATGPTAAGVLTVHPNGAVPAQASNVNFVAGETAANLVMVGMGEGEQVAVWNDSPGHTDAIVDQAGYFIAGY
ncbi:MULTISPECIES: DUF1565 domain-containing protein [unclassified Micromonospora]|uniref:DUF1565 domain-containing protein n=1 Tax=unclassified Micromonospora TaxID=2617518 RepID=UPI002FEF26B5